MLPNLSLPNYEVSLPSNPNLIYKFRPFLVKEEKLLLLTDFSENSEEAVKTILQLLKACCLNEKFDFDKLSYFDLEYLFLALRARSVGEIQTVNYRCTNLVTENPVQGAVIGGDGVLIPNRQECGTMVQVDFDFTKMELEPKQLNNVIKLDDKTTIVMDYPSHSIVREFQTKSNNDGQPLNEEQLFNMSLNFLGQLVNQVITENGTLSKNKDFSFEQAKEWIEQMTHVHFKKLEEFIAGLPKVVVKAPFKCPKCGYTEDLSVEGLQSFFE